MFKGYNTNNLLKIVNISLKRYSEILWKVKIKDSNLRTVWVKNASSGRYLWPLREGIKGFLLEQLSNGGGPGLLQVIPEVSRDARRGALALLLRVFPGIIWEERLKKWNKILERQLWYERSGHLISVLIHFKLNINYHTLFPEEPYQLIHKGGSCSRATNTSHLIRVCIHTPTKTTQKEKRKDVLLCL